GRAIGLPAFGRRPRRRRSAARARAAHRRGPRWRRLQHRRDRRAARGPRRMKPKSALSAEERLKKASDWWSTAIIDIEPGKIAVRGYPIQELIGTLRFPDMIWLMLRGDVPEPAQS